MSWRDECLVIVAAGAGIGYFAGSVWPVIAAVLCIAIRARSAIDSLVQAIGLMHLYTHPVRPIEMQWTLSVVLTERAWETLGVPAEERAALQERLGRFRGTGEWLFAGHPPPNWMSKEIVVTYERWGESLERWRIHNSWIREFRGPREGTYSEERLVEIVPPRSETASWDDQYTVTFWGVAVEDGPHFGYQDGRLLFLSRDRRTTPIMPNGLLWVMPDARVLFDIPAPPLSMARWHRARRDSDSFETSASPAEAPSDFFQTYKRRPGEEMFSRADWDKGFQWLLIIRDLRPRVPATVVRLQWVLWWQTPKRFLVQVGNGQKIWIALGAVEPAADGRSQPRKGEAVEIVSSRNGETIDRVWLTGLSASG